MATTVVTEPRYDGAAATAAPRAPWLAPARIVSTDQRAPPRSLTDAQAATAAETIKDSDSSGEQMSDAARGAPNAAALASRPLQPQVSAPWLHRARTVGATAPQAVSTIQPPPLGAYIDTNDEVMSCSEEEADVEEDEDDNDEDCQEDDGNEAESGDSGDEMQSVMATDSADDSQRRSALDSFHCSSCDIKFAYKHSFTQHQALMHVSAARPFECTDCRLAFPTARELQTHAQSHSVMPGVVHHCGACGADFDSEHSRSMHERSAHGFRCSVETCALSFTRKEHLTRHVARFHQVKHNGEYTCEPCGLEFATRHEKDLHRRAVNHQSFSCTVPGCSKQYSRRDHLTRHVVTAHARDGEAKPFQCELCHVGFAYSHGLVRHMHRSHANANKPYTCEQCLLAFKKKSELQAHSFVHTGVLPFACETCGVRFAKRFQLGRHERLHAAHKEAQAHVIFCDVGDCGAMLFSADEKAKHDREVHQKEPRRREPSDRTGKKRKRSGGASDSDTAAAVDANRRQLLKCEVCGRTLQRKQNLRAHLRTHFEALDERKMHVCPMAGCSNAYTRKSNLMAHYNAVHDAVRSQRFVCPYDGCDGKFGYKKVLTTHIASVHETPSKKLRQQTLVPGRRAQSAKSRVLGMRDSDESSTNSTAPAESA